MALAIISGFMLRKQHIEMQDFIFDVQLNINQSAQRCLFKSPTATEQSRYEVMSAYSYPIGQLQRMIILTKRFHYCGKQAMCEQLVSYSCCLPKTNIVIICDYEFSFFFYCELALSLVSIYRCFIITVNSTPAF